MCNLSNVINTYNSGTETMDLNRTGWYYYFCAVQEHCSNRNLKMKVYVNESLADGTPSGGGSSKSIVIIVVAVIIAIVVILVAVGAVCYYRRRKGLDDFPCSHRSGNSGPRSSTSIPIEILGKDGPREFTFRELAAATKNFSRTELLGRGGFGSVYRGTLRDKSLVAVKCIAKDSQQGESEFLAEVLIIGKIRHRNLVPLRGWCAQREKLLVVYDHMSNGSLDKWIIPSQDGKVKPALQWNTRYSILSGVSAALSYLHEEWQQCILHRDVKPSNILLDDKFNAYLGDFGMARLVDHNKIAHSTIVAGTMGYLAPELPHTHKATTKTDVFSFGVLALEVVCGRRAFDPKLPHDEVYLLDWVWSMHQCDQLRSCVDPRLDDDFDDMQTRVVLHIGLLACHPDPGSRPSMRFIRQVLDGDLSIPQIPGNRPVISYSWGSGSQSTQVSNSMDQSTDGISQSDKAPLTYPR